MMTPDALSEELTHPDLVAARAGDREAFDRLVTPYHRELRAHCARLLGSIHDADDAMQDALLRAWRGLPGFSGRSTLRTWLYRIATNACLALRQRRRPVPVDPATVDTTGTTAARPAGGLTLLPDAHDGPDGHASPTGRIERREDTEVAFVAALEHLSTRERAVLLLRDAMGLTANETAATLGTSVAAVTSGLQRARRKVRTLGAARAERRTLRSLDDARLQRLVTAYVDAWERRDADAVVALVTEDVTFSMPPEPLVLTGREQLRAFLDEAPCRYPWRVVPTTVGGLPAFGCYTLDGGVWVAHSLDVLILDGEAGPLDEARRLLPHVAGRDPDWVDDTGIDRILGLTAFIHPGLLPRIGLPARLDP